MQVDLHARPDVGCDFRSPVVPLATFEDLRVTEDFRVAWMVRAVDFVISRISGAGVSFGSHRTPWVCGEESGEDGDPVAWVVVHIDPLHLLSRLLPAIDRGRDMDDSLNRSAHISRHFGDKRAIRVPDEDVVILGPENRTQPRCFFFVLP